MFKNYAPYKPGLPNDFGKFSPGFQNLFQVSKITRFRVYFQFKIKFKVKKNCVKQYNDIEKIS